jgi:hypothetical protein
MNLSTKMAVFCLTAALLFTGTSFRPKTFGGTMTYGGGSGPQIVATYDGYSVTVAYGTPGTVRLDYNAGGYIYNHLMTPGTPYSIPSNTTSCIFSNYQSTSYYGIY